MAQSTHECRSQGLSGSEAGGWGLEKRQQEKEGKKRASFSTFTCLAIQTVQE